MLCGEGWVEHLMSCKVQEIESSWKQVCWQRYENKLELSVDRINNNTSNNNVWQHVFCEHNIWHHREHDVGQHRHHDVWLVNVTLLS